MPGCYQGKSCPKYDFAAVWGAEKLTEGGDPIPTQDDINKQKAYNALNSLDVQMPPGSVMTQCQLYCQAVREAEAEKCRKLRLKVSLALEKAGCPSNVTPKMAPGGGGCLPCQQPGMLKKPLIDIPSYFSISNTDAATAGSFHDKLAQASSIRPQY